MNSKIILFLLLLGNSIVSCKKKHRDTEVLVDIHILQGKYLSSDYCIDELHAVGRPELSHKCVDSLNNVISLPLNIGTDSTIYAFKEGNRYDTLVLHYQLEAVDDGTEYNLKVKNVELGKYTFEKIEVEFKIMELRNEIESITIYY